MQPAGSDQERNPEGTPTALPPSPHDHTDPVPPTRHNQDSRRGKPSKTARITMRRFMMRRTRRPDPTHPLEMNFRPTRSTLATRKGRREYALCTLMLTAATLCGSTAAQAQAIVPGRCHMGSCWEMIITRKTPIRQSEIGTLYEVMIGSREWPMSSARPSLNSRPFEKAQTSYVLCSTRRPATIFRASEGDTSHYLAHLLNPDGQSYSGYNQGDYSIYWATCHNLVGPNFFSPEMVTRAIQLGYPGNLPQDQIEINHPLDLLR